MTEPIKVLFVCTANICRSAYADARARSMLPEGSGVQVTSAGTWGFDASPMDAEMAHQAKLRDVDPSAFRSRRVNGALVSEADLILTMASEHRSFVLEDWPATLRKTYTLGQFADAVSGAEPALHGRALLDWVRTNRRPPRPDADVADPYRRGLEAASACAERIDELLQQVLGRLEP